MCWRKILEKSFSPHVWLLSIHRLAITIHPVKFIIIFLVICPITKIHSLKHFKLVLPYQVIPRVKTCTIEENSYPQAICWPWIQTFLSYLSEPMPTAQGKNCKSNLLNKTLVLLSIWHQLSSGISPFLLLFRECGRIWQYLTDAFISSFQGNPVVPKN